VEALETDPARGQAAVAFIHRLYDVEREAKAMSPRDRKRLRLAHAKPVLDAFKVWLDAQALIVLPKSVMGQAMAYSLNWKRRSNSAAVAGPIVRRCKGRPLLRRRVGAPIFLAFPVRLAQPLL
jgi:hypothetical protein